MSLVAAAAGALGAMLLFPPSPESTGQRPAATDGSERGGLRWAANLSGPARVIDGDTLDVGGTRVRLHGVDAPEAAQSCFTAAAGWPCGRRATQALAALLDGGSVACAVRDRDRYGRAVAVCRRDGVDVNGWLVAEGWAVAYRRYSHAYVELESAARAAGRGIWAGEFAMPWDWRRGKRIVHTASERPRASGVVAREGERCGIKGNVSYNGDRRLYHMPGDRDYAKTRISPGARRAVVLLRSRGARSRVAAYGAVVAAVVGIEQGGADRPQHGVGRGANGA